MRAQREAKKRAKAMDASGSGGVIGGMVGEDELSRSKRRSKKCECIANVYASVNREGEWVIRIVELEHTGHAPNRRNARLVKEYRMKHFTSRVRKKLHKYFENGLPVKQIHGCFGTEMVDSEPLPFNVKDIEHEVYKRRRLLMEGSECVAMMKFFQQMQSGNINFYFSQRLDDEAPKAMLTDQAAAMRKPLEEVMPMTRHQWCIWHIMRKIPEKLGKCEKYQELKRKLKCVVYESFNVQEFENNWNEVVTKYELQSNEWLDILCKERHMWLFEFPQKYDKAVEKRVDDEVDADEKCAKYIRRLVSGFAVEKLFQKLYMDTKFQEVQTECCRLMYCYPREENIVSENLIQYLIEDRVWIVPEGKNEAVLTNRRRFYSATFHTETKIVCCDCRKFETDGIICRHIIRIPDLNQVVDIPQRYILSHWRKDLLRMHTGVKVSKHDPSKTGLWKR
ncbi:protein FAR1-RELATED SEQUENCE 1-like [Chenopodium quinoa]|uniref:protein FAR1-RELATED SEQUENCE 1-like n=1 Tax=Chenopodium quinoa TaxID=63459 RepID=UPI000B7783F8|nr:protein FAR1-RELATED SEQUENCE 1-like [Chenopodium quinoa]